MENKEKIKERALRVVRAGKITSMFSERELFVMNHRLIEKMTFERIGKIMGVSRERVRQIEAKILKKLRNLD